jgi:hypothetical protein
MVRKIDGGGAYAQPSIFPIFYVYCTRVLAPRWEGGLQ